MNTKLNKEANDPATWIREHGDYLLNVAFMYVKDRELAEDLVQDVFVSAIKAKDSFEGRASPRTWLRTILKNKIIDNYRKTSREPKKVELEEDFKERAFFFNNIGIWKKIVPSWNLDPEDIASSKEFVQILKDCIHKLPKRQRHAFMLRTFEGTNSEEICKELEISTSNYWVLIHRARMSLKGCLDNNWFN